MSKAPQLAAKEAILTKPPNHAEIRAELEAMVVGLLPEESVERIKGRFGTKFRKLSPLAVQALVTADLEGGVSNPRMRQICNEHPSELTKLLQGLVSGGFYGRMVGGEARHTCCRDWGAPHL